jgi:hypothetical protein
MAESQSEKTTRHTDSVDASELIEGDRINPKLVARNRAQLGSPIRRSRADEDGDPPTQLVTITEIDTMEDVHRAILTDADTDVWVVAVRHDSQSAWSQREADWTVKQVGDSVTVTDGEVEELADGDDPVDDETEWMATWTEVVLCEPDVADRRELVSNDTLRLHDDHEGRKGYATVEFSWLTASAADD